jgi:DNA polymerase-4
MDAFYASVEQRDNPALQGRPVAVGGSRERGVVAAASYEARRYGVRSAMSSAAARRRCPDLVFVTPRFDAYRSVSQEIRSIFADYTTQVEPLSLDEAYLDVTADLKGIRSATLIAQDIRARIRQQTGLTASAGVSYNKFLAKLASDHCKPDGLCVIAPEDGPGFVESVDVAKFHGVGPVTAAKMHRLGLFTGLQLRAQTRAFLAEHFGSAADYYHGAARGIDHRPVRADRPRKSIGSETTFARDLTQNADLVSALQPSIESVWASCSNRGIAGRTVVLKAKYADFRQVTRSRTWPAPVADLGTLTGIAHALLATLLPPRTGVRLLGVSVSGLEQAGRRASGQQLPLFP